VDGSRQVFTPSVSNLPRPVTDPNLSGSQLRLTRFSSKERRLPSSRYCAFVIAWNWLTECVNAFISSLIEESKGVSWPYLPVLGPCQKGGKLYGSKDVYTVCFQFTETRHWPQFIWVSIEADSSPDQDYAHL
jgi:hypothetical protein